MSFIGLSFIFGLDALPLYQYYISVEILFYWSKYLAKMPLKVRYCPGINQTSPFHAGSHASASSSLQKLGHSLATRTLVAARHDPPDSFAHNPAFCTAGDILCWILFLHFVVVSGLHLPSPRKEIPKPTERIF